MATQAVWSVTLVSRAAILDHWDSRAWGRRVGVTEPPLSVSRPGSLD